MKYFFTRIAVGISVFLIPLTTLAHVKWFVESGAMARPYRLTDAPVIISIIAALALVAIGVFLERKLSVSPRIQAFTKRIGEGVLSIASIGFSIAFIIFSLSGFIFAPNLPGTPLLLILQAIAGVLILLGLFERVGALLLLVLFGIALHQFGVVEMLDTVEMLGFALYALILGRPKYKLVQADILSQTFTSLRPYAVPILRILTGVNLLILGFSEKILAPDLTQTFLAHYDWNFMTHLGFNSFTNYWFAYAAGVVEALFGVFLILGLVTRTTIIVLAVFLVTTLILLGPVELIGHLPHFSIAIVLLVLGSGKRS